MNLEKGCPVGPRILIQTLDVDKEEKVEKEESLIFLPDSARRQMTHNATKGKVLKMGADCYNEVFKERIGAVRPWCKEGDIVLFRSHASLFLDDSANGLVIVNDQDIIYNFSR